MENLLIALTEEQGAFIRDESRRGGHATPDDYVRALIVQEQHRQAKRELDAKLLEALESPAIPVDQEFWDSIRREALEGLAPEEIRP